MATSERFHALDAARGFALLLGILLHTTMSFFLLVPAQDVSQSSTLAVTFFVIHTFRMSLFYVIAGFFAHMTLHRRGLRAFLKDRAKRVVVPMTVGWLLLAPLTIAAVVWGFSRTFPNGLPAGTDAATLAPQGFPLIHLWFLYYLCIFYALALALRTGWAALDHAGAWRSRVDAAMRGAHTRYLLPLLLALPTFAVFYLDVAWPIWFGIHTPDQGLMPKLPAMICFGTAFGFGWLLNRQVASLEVFRQHWLLNTVTAMALTTVCLIIVGPLPSATAPTLIEGGSAMRALYAGCYALSIWCWTFGLIGAAVRFCSGANAVRRYLADASYWFYLAHMPIVFALQVALMRVPLHWSIKFPLIVAITFIVLLASYHYLVRSSIVGELLNGRRYPSRPEVPGLRGSPNPNSEVTSAGQGSADHARVDGVGRLDHTLLPMAVLDTVTKRFGETKALDGVCLVVRPGEILAVLGPNGAGKSTAIGLWLGILQADEGAVSIMGGSPMGVHSRLGVGLMLQEVNLAPELSAREHIALTSAYYRHPLGIEETVALTGIQTFADKRYRHLSGGQKRRVQFATAVCGRPRLLFLDEPTVGLDTNARQSMWENIRRLRDAGCSIVLTTHYLEEAEALADRVVVIASGKVIAEGSVAEMRSLVSRRKISCTSAIALENIRRWPGVVDAVREQGRLQVTAVDAESVVRLLLSADQELTHLEVKQASLADAFTELTREAA